MSSYARGRRIEWLIKDRLEELGFQVTRAAGSKSHDLVIGGIPVEVKLRRTIPKDLALAKAAFLEDNGFVAAPFLPFLGLSGILPAQGKISRWAQRLVPCGGLLIIHTPRSDDIVVAKKETMERIRDELHSIIGHKRR